MRIVISVLLLLLAAPALASDLDVTTFTCAGNILHGVGFSFATIPDTRACDEMLLTGHFEGDSLKYYLDYSCDGVVFNNYESATVASGDSVWSRVVLTKTVGGATYQLNRIIWPFVRLRIENVSAADTLSNIEFKLWCGR